MWPCERLESVDSTQREMQRRLGLLNGPAAVWTTRQTAGIASHGRSWKDSPEGLAWSAAWPASQGPQVGLQVGPQVGLQGAWPARLSLMVLEVLEGLYPATRGRLGLKWPNDLMVAEGKLCGVLVSQHHHFGRPWLIAGIGINLCWTKPPGVDRPVADLRSLGVKADPALIAEHLCTATASLSACSPDPRWSAEFSRRDVMLGRQVAVVHPHSGETLHTGLHQGIDAQGRLMLFSQGRLLPVQIGELSLRSLEQAA